MFQGEAQVLRMVSTFSLQQAWRGQPLLLELFVIPGEEGRGVRLLVNELPYHPVQSAQVCKGFGSDPATAGVTRFARPEATEHSFVLADKLAYCRFSYLQHPKDDLERSPSGCRSWPIRAGREPSESKWPRSNQTPQGCSPHR